MFLRRTTENYLLSTTLICSTVIQHVPSLPTFAYVCITFFMHYIFHILSHFGKVAQRNDPKHSNSKVWANNVDQDQTAPKGTTLLALQSASLDTNQPLHEKTCLCHMRTTEAQISLRICAFVVRHLDSIIPLFAIAEISRP